ncbi:hypothetical protein GOODEAATRI_015850 [Goodea atripinnis]|uniref:Uncharacterized protein n=1 Tax=Goodea atripinnis TaxID=208336 RepID=A0ABV0P4L2_9TELE
MEERNEELKRPWDTCREVPLIEEVHTPWKLIKLLKIITLFAVAIIVFGLAICSKVLFFEFIVSVGLAVLTIVAMPHLDIVTNVTILSGVAVLSALLQAVAQCTVKKINIFLLPSIIASLVIFLGYGLFIALYIMKDPKDAKTAIWVGLAIGGSILVSFNWWENYFGDISVKSKSNFLKNLFEDLTKCQNMLHIFSSLLRIVVTACVLGAYVPLAKMDWDVVTSIPSRETRIVAIIIGVQLISSALCHWFALAACKMHAIRRCFILPLYLSSLAVIALFIVPVVIYYQDYKLGLNTTENINFTRYCTAAVNETNQNPSGNVFPQLVLDVTQTLCFLDLAKTANIGLLTGPAVWFQKFEYAVSHWLQKTAEHVFGSVLCSPGCFTSMVKEKTILTPSSIFIVAMSIIYIVTALMHPQELPLVFYGILYIACIPSAYLLLTIYSMANMNSVSWGTRETKPAAEAATTAATINFSFFILNAFWLVAAFTFQVFEVFNIEINTVDPNLNGTGVKIQIEPISLMFILGFALSVLLQFIGMFYHR